MLRPTSPADGRRCGLEPPWSTECVIATGGITVTSVLSIALFQFTPERCPRRQLRSHICHCCFVLALLIALDPAEPVSSMASPLLRCTWVCRLNLIYSSTSFQGGFGRLSRLPRIANDSARVCYKSVPGLDHHCMWVCWLYVFRVPSSHGVVHRWLNPMSRPSELLGFFLLSSAGYNTAPSGRRA